MSQTKSATGENISEKDVQWMDRVVEDFRSGNDPFGNEPALENQYVDEFDTDEDLARFLMSRHWNEMWQMYSDYPELFVPSEVAERGESWLQSLFSVYGVRYPNRDSDAWRRIARFLVDEHDGSVALMEHVRAGDCPFLGGEKICPFWIRLLHDHVHFHIIWGR